MEQGPGSRGKDGQIRWDTHTYAIKMNAPALLQSTGHNFQIII